LKVAIVTPRFHPHIGGVETHVKEISERLLNNDFDVEILTTDPTKELLLEDKLNNLKIRRFPSWAPNEAYCFSNELKIFLRNHSSDYDVVHAHQYHAFPALYASQTKKKNFFIFNPHYHGKGHTFFRNLLLKPYKFIGKNIFKKADKIVCVSEFEKRNLMKDFHLDVEKISVIPNGINFDEFKNVEKRDDKVNSILSVCRLEEYKGVQYIIEAMQYLPVDFVLNIVGNGTYKKYLMELTDKLGLNDRINFFHDLSRSKLLEKYFEADLFLLLSRFEAYGITVAEALASQTPCIVANTSALTEWVDNVNCFGLDYPISIDELQSLMLRVIGTRTENVNLVDWDKTTSMLISLYRELL